MNPTSRIYTEETDISALAGSWRALQATTGLAPFTDYDWAMAWWRIIGKPAGAKLLVACLYEEDRLVGLIPFSIRKKLGVRVLRLLGHEAYYYRNFLIEAPPYAPLLWDAVLACDAYDVADIKNLHVGTAEEAHLSQHARRIDRANVYYFDQLGNHKSFRDDVLPKRVRRKIRSVEALVDKDPSLCFHACEHACPEGKDCLCDVLNFLIRRKTMWVRERGKRGLFDEENVHAFYHEIGHLAAQKNQLFLAWITKDEKIVAATFYVGEKSILYGHTSAFDPQVKALSPGIYLNALAMEWAATHGYTEKNFMEGEEEYKTRFTKTGRMIHSYMWARTRRGQVFLWLYLILRQYRQMKRGLANLCRV